MKELTILMGWHNEADTEKIRAYEENKASFTAYNPDIEIITVMNTIQDTRLAWLGTDLGMFEWYIRNGKTQASQRYLLVEWDCWCDCDLRTYFELVWDFDVVAPSVKYPERDHWDWFSTIRDLPPHARQFATGIVPFCGILLSDTAMEKISTEILKPVYRHLNSELRMATIATMLKMDPVVNPVCNRTINWREFIPFDRQYKGLHHPRKKLAY